MDLVVALSALGIIVASMPIILAILFFIVRFILVLYGYGAFESTV